MIAFLVVFMIFPLCKRVLYSRDVPLGVLSLYDYFVILLDMTLIQ